MKIQPSTKSHLFSAWISKERTYVDVLSSRLVQSFVATFDPFLFSLPTYQAPLGSHWCLAPELTRTSELERDGHPSKGDFLPPISLPRRMWAGGEIEFVTPLNVGDEIVRRSAISEISEKVSANGPLTFVKVRHELIAPTGVGIIERQDIVYRSAAVPRAPSTTSTSNDTKPRHDLVWHVPTPSPLLLRYSALTFNSHRIHYDLAYSQLEEGYSGLVVHGPLQATILLNVAAALGESTPHIFSYRAVSPLISGSTFHAKARRDSDQTIACWAENSSGVVTMKGQAIW